MSHACLERSRPDANQKMDFSISRREVLVLEKQELDLPETHIVDSEAVGLRPVLAIGQGDPECGPRRSVELESIIQSRCGIMDDSQAYEVDSDSVVDARGFVVRDAEDDRP